MNKNNDDVRFTIRIETHSDDRELNSSEELIYAIDRINNKGDEFVVVSSVPPINKVTFIQTTYVIPNEGEEITDEFYIVEAQTQEEDGEFVQHNLETKDFETVVNIFKKYFEEHETPDFTSWDSELLSVIIARSRR